MIPGTYPMKSATPGCVAVVARIQGAANSSPSTIKGSYNPGLISSVSRTAVGRLRIFLADVCPQLDSIEVAVQDSNYATTATRRRAKVISHDVTNTTAASRYIDVAIVEPGFVVDEWTNAIASDTAGLKAATATTVAPQTILAAALIAGGKTELAARPRNITFTTAGADPTHAPATVTITGTDIHGDTLTETLALSQAAGTDQGVKAFKTIVSIVYGAALDVDATVAIGFGKKFGLSRKAKTRAGAVMRGTEISAGTVVTNGTLVVAETATPNGTYSPNTNPDGAVDYALAYESEGEVDLSTTEWLHLTLNLRNTSQGVS